MKETNSVREIDNVLIRDLTSVCATPTAAQTHLATFLHEYLNLINSIDPPRVLEHEHALHVLPKRANDPPNNGNVV